jgi:hypothetical protein
LFPSFRLYSLQGNATFYFFGPVFGVHFTDVIDDKTNFFATLFDRVDAKELSKSLGPINSEAFAKRLKDITDYERITSLWQQMATDPKRHIDVGDQYIGEPGTFVRQGTFAVKPLDKPLATADIDTCAGLVIIDKKAGRQYLAHIDSMVSSESIKQSLKNFDLARSDIYIVEGNSPSGTVQSILTSILDNPSALKNLKFLDTHGLLPALIIHNGKIYQITNDTKDWNSDELSRFKK